MLAISINTVENSYARLQRLISSRLIGWIGVISYSIYIWQQPFFYSIDRFGAAPMLAAAIAAGCVSFYLYEDRYEND